MDSFGREVDTGWQGCGGRAKCRWGHVGADTGTPEKRRAVSVLGWGLGMSSGSPPPCMYGF